MRLKLVLKIVEGTVLPCNYMYELSSCLYKVLNEGNPVFTAWLHDKGYCKEKKAFKLFTFSNFYFPCFRIEGDRIFVLADTDIFAKAPARLTAAGVSDILGKYIALADWKIASILMDEYYCTAVVDLETKAIRTVKDNLKEIAAGEKDACEKLMYALILSGLAMQMTGNSRPASGAEHHMVHLWDMEVVNGHLDALHGEKVSAATMLVLLEYKKLADAIRRGACRVHAFTDGDRELLQKTFGRKGILGALEKENTPELLDDVSTETLSGALPEILKIIDLLPAVTDMQEMMSIVGCVSRVRDIGLPGKAIEESLRLAPYTRRRLSLLRLRKMLTY